MDTNQFADDIILYLQCSIGNLTKRFLELANEFSKATIHKMNTLDSRAYLYTNHTPAKKETGKNPIHKEFKKYLRGNLTKEVFFHREKNKILRKNKILTKQLHKTLENGKTSNVHGFTESILVKQTYYQKIWIYKFPVQSP